jgi:drug/metabolite transporter (DMT)-like permease
VLVLVIPLALLSALMYAFSDFFEQRAASLDAAAAHEVTVGPERSRIGRALAGVVATMRRLVRDRRWAAGWAIGTLALFVIPLSTVYSPLRPGLRDYGGALLVCAGLVVVIAVRGGAENDEPPRRPSILLFIAVLLVVAGLVAVASRSPGPIRVTALATAAGVSFGSSAALVKLTTSDLTTRGIGATARDWPGYALAVATGAGLVIQQLAFAAGRLAAATTAMIVANPIVGYAVAVFGFGEHLPGTPGRLAGLAVGGLCAVVGVVMLAHSPVLFGEDT